ncbi:hypothetical protein RDWZM_004980 [Blomia tropicalis]|uniref:Uncharacterized protein n=1 Tax=Blomia tropicalis TaxID=40697 RepID=A0A9Q0M361_BLOTA|nr:hypothetical protein RDWZM_004980 [Blomia tropicalis]
MAVAVKELIENSVDANAKSLSIRFVEYGKDLIEVIDNGDGIENDNFCRLGKRNCTSKIFSFEDLDTVETFGFRGEAISSLCNISNVTIHTRHVSANIGTKLTFNIAGDIIQEDSMAREIGTTVSLNKIFLPLPVRRKELEANFRRIFDRTLSLIYQYCVGMIGIRIACYHRITRDGHYTNLFTSNGLSIQSNIIEIFDYKQFSSLMPFVCHTDINDKSIDEEDRVDFKLTGYISKPDSGCGRSSSDRQYFYLNDRPCDLTTISKRINQIYRTYNRNQYPFVLLRINIQEQLIDRNLTPDKRKILLADNHYIFKIIQHSLDRMFSRETADVATLSSSQTLLSYLNRGGDDDDGDAQTIKRSYSSVSSNEDESFESQTLKLFKRRPSPCNDLDVPRQAANESVESVWINPVNESIGDNHYRFVSHDDSRNMDNVDTSSSCSQLVLKRSTTSMENKSKNVPIMKHPFFASLPKTKLWEKANNDSRLETSHNEENVKEKETNNLENSIVPSMEDVTNVNVSNSTTSLSIEDENGDDVDRPNDHRNSVGEVETIDVIEVGDEECTLESITRVENMVIEDCDIDTICEQYRRNIYEAKRTNVDSVPHFTAQIIPEHNEQALNELRHLLTKQSFNRMKVIGQFNLGFIIAKIENDLFIIDQHAIDERQNFETLLKNPETESQKLVCPQNLRLNSLNEMIVMENLPIFKELGFEFEIEHDKRAGQRVLLSVVPFGKEWIGGLSDVEEIIAAIRESPTGDIITGRRFVSNGLRREIAYRACRSSIMVGDTLFKPQMEKMLQKMCSLCDPWHCAHNRPTIRHLLSLTQYTIHDQ